MSAVLRDPVLLLAVRLALALLFAMACWHKLRGLDAFRDTLADYDLVPPFLLGVVSWLVIAAEAAIVASLLLPGAATAGGLAAAALLGLYVVAIGINLVRGRRSIDCGCGGASLRQPISEWLVLRNLLLIGVACLAGLAPAPRSLSAWDYGLVASAVLVLALLYGATEQLLANAPRLYGEWSASD